MMRENRSERSRRYWTEFCDYLRQRGSQLESLEPMVSDYKHYRDFRIGIPGVAVRARQQERAGTRDGRGLSAAFILQGRNRTEESRLLQEQQAEIENEYGELLSWYAVKSENCVNVATMDVDVTDETDWPNQHEWLATKLEKLVKVFCPRILELRAADWHPLEKINTEEDSFVEEMKALQEQLTREFAETRDVLKSVVEEILGVREDLKRVRTLLGDIV